MENLSTLYPVYLSKIKELAGQESLIVHVFNMGLLLGQLSQVDQVQGTSSVIFELVKEKRFESFVEIQQVVE